MDLVQRLKAECAGVYYADHLPEATEWGSNVPLLGKCKPSENIPFWSSRYRHMLSSLRREVFHDEAVPRRMDSLYFLHYEIDKDRVMRQVRALSRRIQSNAFLDHINTSSSFFQHDDLSAIYTNHLGEGMYVGPGPVLQDVMNAMKQGFKEAAELLTAITECDWQFKNGDDVTGRPQISVIELFDQREAPRYVKLVRE